MKAALLVCLVSLTNAFIFPPRSTIFRLKTPSSVDLCSVPPVPYASPDQVKSKLTSALEEFAKDVAQLVEKDVGGTVVNLVYKDKVIWSKGFGVRNMSEHGPDNTVNGDSIFRIGSITKVFTAMMMLQLRDKGYISSINADLSTVLPELQIKNPFKQKRSITFDQLSSHMSGLPRETPCPHMFLNGCNLTFTDIYARLSKMELMYPPGTWPQYSNLGVAILGRAVEKIGGKPWDTMLEDMILKPLGMASTVNGVDQSMMQRLAVGYFPDSSVAKLIDIGFEAPAGQLYSTANDLSKFMVSIMNNMDSNHSDALLDSETLREWMQPVYVYKDGTGYGRPWELMPIGNYTLRTKGGAINGYEAEFLMAPEIKTGVVIMNSCLNCPSYQAVVVKGAELIATLGSHLYNTDLLPPVKLPPTPQNYVGTYIGKLEFRPNDQDTVTVILDEVNGQKVLMGQKLGFSMKLDWHPELGSDTFQISGRGMSFPCPILSDGILGEYVHFKRDQAGMITSFLWEGWLPGIVYQKT